MNFKGRKIDIKYLLTKVDELTHQVPWCVVVNFIILYFCYLVCRIAFIVVNYDMFAYGLYPELIWRLFKGGILFDTSAIFYTNLIYLILVFLPWKKKESPIIHKITKWIFIVVNTFCIIINLADSIYFPFSEKRATLQMLHEFSGNTNGGAVVGIELLNQWPLVLLTIVLVFILIKGYRSAQWNFNLITSRQYHIRQAVCFVVFGFFSLIGIRGSFFIYGTRPMSMTLSYYYADTPTQAAIVTNTPFSAIRTALKRQAHVPKFFDNDEEMADYFNAVHLPDDTTAVDKRNVVILIMESFAEEFIGGRNRDLDNGEYKGYTEFIDSLLPHCLTYQHTYANGWISIDAMPSILSSVPKMYYPFVLSPNALDNTPGIAKELGTWGYETAFFHGAENSSMGFSEYASASGFNRYFGRTEYEADSRTGGAKDFDGVWAIWDEEFLQWMCLKLDEMPQPFLASVFTATSHHPFQVPDRYKNIYTDDHSYPIHKCIRYSDNALRMFFAAAKEQPWYENTIFVITADHASSRVTHEVYRTAEGDFRIPILFFDPSGKIGTGNQPGIAQQIDIMPTLLGILGYDKPYVAFGKDLRRINPQDTWAFNWHNVPQYIKGDYLLQFNDFEISGIYNLRDDRMMRNNLMGTDNYDRLYVDGMQKSLEAILQDVDTRMRNKQMRYKTSLK